MSGAGRMETVISKHLFTLYPGEIVCDCEWAAQDDVTRQGDGRLIVHHCAHLAQALRDAGFGHVAAAKAEAWDEGYERRAASLGMTADPNPYRADQIEGDR